MQTKEAVYQAFQDASGPPEGGHYGRLLSGDGDCGYVTERCGEGLRDGPSVRRTGAGRWNWCVSRGQWSGHGFTV